RLDCDFNKDREALSALAEMVVYTGAIDELFDCVLGRLEYRSLKFETEILDTDNFQGNAVVNYTSRDVPFTRIIEHKHFEYGTRPKTVITREYPKTYAAGDEPYYPVNDEKNDALAEKYKALARDKGYILGGRLGDYKYYDMDKIIKNALNLANNI
ncbi:MAG: UDP-galactopyranose mutase, partial [Clostridia bacterium]|nr:UDP-galactopyranose mutase [Clostridia bacterium]